ncbi:MAG: hypothetical protein BWY71_00075 [Planctomycetes bacterium ADurb.Bin412]|nr:MAG: hypothetical protein BWY71_00075 [Planctomycetes bacterium ADurb.Bin412]
MVLYESGKRCGFPFGGRDFQPLSGSGKIRQSFLARYRPGPERETPGNRREDPAGSGQAHPGGHPPIVFGRGDFAPAQAAAGAELYGAGPAVHSSGGGTGGGREQPGADYRSERHIEYGRYHIGADWSRRRCHPAGDFSGWICTSRKTHAWRLRNTGPIPGSAAAFTTVFHQKRGGKISLGNCLGTSRCSFR